MGAARQGVRIDRADIRVLLWIFSPLLIINILSWRYPFFWDNILNAKIAHWYLETGFAQLPVPSALDAGHPPFFSLYLAGLWAIFGKSLVVAHIAILPFTLGNAWLFYRLAKRFLPADAVHWAMAFFVMEPALFTQNILVAPDVALLFFFLLAVNSILTGRRVILALAMLGMGAISFRGILAFGAVFLIDLGLAWIRGVRRPVWIRAWPYALVALVTAIWLWIHYQSSGWLFSPPAETYGGHRKLAAPPEMMRNMGLILWRWVDHGRIFLWMLAGLGIALAMRNRFRLLQAQHRTLLVLAAAPFLVLALLFIPFTNPIGHRYFLAGYALLALLAVRLAWDFFPRRWAIAACYAVLVGFLSGHLWVYPDTVAKGWDSTLAHWPYHKQRREIGSTIDHMGIPRHSICSDFPVLAADKFLYPADPDTATFRSKDEGFQDCPYVLYSSVSNGYTDAELAALADTTQWQPLVSLGGWPVRTVLYARHP